MTVSQIIDDKINLIIGSKLSSATLYANMLGLHFDLNEKGYALHIQSFMRIIHKGKIIVTSGDYFIYDGEDKTGTFNDLWINMKMARDLIIGSSVLSIKHNDFGDIDIILSNDSEIEIKISNSKTNFIDRIEQYRFFPTHENKKHFVVYSNGDFDE